MVAEHVVSLSPPRIPGGRGNDGRWSLNIFHRPAGVRIPLFGVSCASEAIAAAAEHLDGFDPDWQPAGPSFIAANPHEHQPERTAQ